jgi:hypothetical protein
MTRLIAPRRNARGEEQQATGPNVRGYFVTVQLTSPYKNATSKVEEMLKQLSKQVSEQQAAKDGKTYYVARTLIVSAQQITRDAERKNVIKAAFDLKKAAAEKAKGNVDPRNGTVTPPAGIRPQFDTGRGGGQEDEAEKARREAEPFLDPMYPGETVLNDWAITVVLAVALDPKPASGGGGATSADAGSNDPADRNRAVAAGPK